MSSRIIGINGINGYPAPGGARLVKAWGVYRDDRDERDRHGGAPPMPDKAPQPPLRDPSRSIDNPTKGSIWFCARFDRVPVSLSKTPLRRTAVGARGGIRDSGNMRSDDDQRVGAIPGTSHADVPIQAEKARAWPGFAPALAPSQPSVDKRADDLPPTREERGPLSMARLAIEQRKTFFRWMTTAGVQVIPPVAR